MGETDSFPDPAQQAVIEHGDGALLVLAPAGSGKTRVMAERLARAISDGIDPNQTLCVTFTNRAAREMRSRVEARLGRVSRETRISTFHALCAWMLRIEARTVGIAQDFVIYDDADSVEVLRQVSGMGEKEAKEFFFRMSEAKSHAPDDALSLDEIPSRIFDSLDRTAARRYHAAIVAQHALDFADLVYRVRAMLAQDRAVATRWDGRFDWIQIDEIQDTHHSEFDVIRRIGAGCLSLSLFGDLDQTIYEWRGSDPERVLAAFHEAFGPIHGYELTYNYRSTRQLLSLAERFKASFERQVTQLVPCPGLPLGGVPDLIEGPDVEEEAQQIALNVLRRRRDGERIGILTPTHRMAEIVSRALTHNEVPHVTVEEYEFFRRQEIKDALARLRLILNPWDGFSARRMLLRPAVGIGDATMAKVRDDGAAVHLRLSDLLSPQTHRHGDPYGCLLREWREGRVVVLDVESTGLDTARDEIVEIAALRRGAGGTVEEFHCFIRPRRAVGDSEQVHGLSDAFLREEGGDARTVFSALARFTAGVPVFGHNVSYDVEILRSHGKRVGVEIDFPEVYDTLDTARRLWSLERHDLKTLCAALRTEAKPTHHAMDDVRATLEVLAKATDELAHGAIGRMGLVAEAGERFRPLAEQLKRWRDLARRIRPADLLETVLEESALLKHYARDRNRLRHLEDFVTYMRQNDNVEEDPRDALGRLTRNAALARNVDHLDPDDPRIPVITIHQAKGLEFDGVHIAGVIEEGIPSYFAIRDDKIEEQRRLFYVALTRPKKWITFSWSRKNANGYASGPSRFLFDAGLVR